MGIGKNTVFMRSMFNATFKANSYMERAIMTGITRVSKESMFSDLNNLNVVTLTSDEYASAFGFTEEEVFAALDIYGMSKEKEKIKKWNGKQALINIHKLIHTNIILEHF